MAVQDPLDSGPRFPRDPDEPDSGPQLNYVKPEGAAAVAVAEAAPATSLADENAALQARIDELEAAAVAAANHAQATEEQKAQNVSLKTRLEQLLHLQSQPEVSPPSPPVPDDPTPAPEPSPEPPPVEAPPADPVNPAPVEEA